MYRESSDISMCVNKLGCTKLTKFKMCIFAMFSASML